MSAFSPPPPYYELFTDAARDDPSNPDHKLFVPPPPVEKPFLKFQAIWQNSHIDHRLDPNVRRLFDLSSPSHPIAADAEMTPETITRTGPGVVARELHSLNKQLSERFINLLTVVSDPALPPAAPPGAPPQNPAGEALFELWTVFNNTATLLSLLRRSQARQGVVALARAQNDAMHAKAEKLEAATQAVRTLLHDHGLLSDGDDSGDDVGETAASGAGAGAGEAPPSA